MESGNGREISLIFNLCHAPFLFLPFGCLVFRFFFFFPFLPELYALLTEMKGTTNLNGFFWGGFFFFPSFHGQKRML
ncbi:hypothetical protein IWX48DRAFT_623645 [Phyllosticta citricarpa]